MTSSVAMDIAVHALRRFAGSLEYIARRAWRVEVATNSRGELAIMVLLPPERPGEFDAHRRANTRQLVPQGQFPAPVSQIADQLARVVANRGLRGRLDVYWREVGSRDVWTYELSVVAPDAIEQRKLKNRR
ncbi:hypothetical protein LZC95_07890 [Pendulispora brunnea]|uniref:Uncharacterized protein n=1 Tax=Pendulispora brunnea TaxID=2905690 RepID=A0ABZ2KK63_9BACT